MALSSLSCFISGDLARDLSGDIMTMLTSTKPYLRKKAVLILYKVFLRYPEALRPAFPRLREKLEDPDPGVQSAAVNVICELARKNPKNYLSLAPTFFKLMTTSTNNWMLIKIIKLFGALTPLEPRLGKKLIEPLTNLIHSTSAMSLLYECINTVIAVLISISSGMPNHTAAIQLCVQKLRILIEDSDQNLKYLGLLAMSKILRTHPKSVQGHKDLVMQCLDDSDESIRLRALDLLYGMVSKKNLMEIVKKLMAHMEKAEGTTYRDELMEKIVGICSQNDYQFITNFEWYISVLVELTRAEGGGSRHGPLIAAQMMDVAIRVESVRGFAVRQMALLIDNAHLLVSSGASRGGAAGGVQRNSSTEVLYAASWICGEFASHLGDGTVGASDTLRAMFRGRVASLPGHIQAVYVQNGIKLFAHVAAQDGCSKEELSSLAAMMEESLGALVVSSDLEVQERASSALQVVKYVIWRLEKDEDGEQEAMVTVEVEEAGGGAEELEKKGAGAVSQVGEELSRFFAGELNPVGPKAQKKVPIPEGLDLDEWINEPPPESEEEEEDEEEDDYNVFVNAVRSAASPKADMKGKKKHKKHHRHNREGDEAEEPSEEDLKKAKEARLLEQSMNPNYLKDSPRSPARSSATGGTETPVDDGSSVPPVQPIDLGVPLHIPGLASADQYLNISRDSSVQGERAEKAKKKKKHKKKHRKSTASSGPGDDEDAVVVVVTKNLEMPEGAELTDDEDRAEGGSALAPDDPHRALADVRLDDIEFQEPYKSKEDGGGTGGGGLSWRGEDSSIPTSLFGEGDEGAKKKKKKKKAEEDENEGQEEEEDGGNKKKRHKKHKKRRESELVNGNEGDGEGDEKKSKKKKKKKDKAEEEPADGDAAKTKKKKKDKSSTKPDDGAVPDTDDIDFWLSSNNGAAAK